MTKVSIERIDGSAAQPRLNVVFVHGLGGGPKETWTYKANGTDNRFWPDWLVTDVLGLAAYTIGYPADKMGWNKGWPIEQAAVAVLNELLTDEGLRAAAGPPIVFVCHSLGGIIVKKLVLKANSVREADTPTGVFLDRIAGVVFIATPHDGSTLATLASKFGWIVSDTMKDLVANSAKLGDISNDYRNYIAANKRRIRHKVYYENDKVDVEKPVGAVVGRIFGVIVGKIVGWAVGKVVTSGSANPGLVGPDPVPVGRDHINICKVSDRTDTVYKGVLVFLEEALEPRPPPTREVVESVKDDTGAIREQQRQDSAKLDEIYAFVQQSGVMQRAADQGIPEPPVRAIVERLGGLGLARDDLVPWLENWIIETAREKSAGANEGEAFERAFEKAQRLFDEGRIAEASSPFMAELALRQEAEKKRREESKRTDLRLVVEAIKFDARAFNGEAAAAKLCIMAKIEGAETPDAMGAYLVGKAEEFYDRGDQRGDNAALIVSVAAYRAALEEYTRDRARHRWAATQNNLGLALWKLGERESGTTRLKEAIIAYRAALEEFTREREPLNWAATQNNLGSALAALGEREIGTACLKEAVAAHREALKEFTLKDTPDQWAMAQSNLGGALNTLGKRENDIGILEQAVTASREALKGFTRDHFPREWAVTHNNLGGALQEIGAGEDGTEKLKEAVTAYREALKELTLGHFPLDWAMTQSNIGAALEKLSERENKIENLENAVTAHREALKGYTRDRAPHDWAITQYNLGIALQKIGMDEDGTEKLEHAVTVYREALEVFTREHAAPQWASTQNNLGTALRMLGEREDRTDKLKEAVTAYREALKEKTRERVPLQWAATQRNLGTALSMLGKCDNKTEWLEQAETAYREALKEYTSERNPGDWIMTTGYLNVVLALLRTRRNK